MIKSPISKTGDIKYFEVIKIVILISLFYGYFTKYSVESFSTISQATPIMIIIISVLFIVQIVLTGFKEAQELMDLVLSFKLIPATQKRLKLEIIHEIVLNVKDIFITIKTNTYLRINVIRC